MARQEQLRDHLLTEKQALVGMHQPALADRGAGLHRRDLARSLPQPKARNASGNRTGRNDQILVFAEIELIDQPAQQVGINLPARSDKAGADFDDNSHIVIFLRLIFPRLPNAESSPSGAKLRTTLLSCR